VIRQLFLDGARVVVDAISSPPVAAAWGAPSVLADQTVGGLAGHLARGGIWVVGDYLDEPEPDAAMLDSADDYFAAFKAHASEAGDRAIRARGAAVAAAGPDAVAAQAAAALVALEVRLPAERPDRRTVVAGGASMGLDDYLVTRVVEQVVHLDDVARSIGCDGFAVPDANVRLVLATGAWTGLRRFGAASMIRALFREDEGALPVL
jgi:Mycothiol maleylpyruvate isomerase N-terminal domain